MRTSLAMLLTACALAAIGCAGADPRVDDLTGRVALLEAQLARAEARHRALEGCVVAGDPADWLGRMIRRFDREIVIQPPGPGRSPDDPATTLALDLRGVDRMEVQACLTAAGIPVTFVDGWGPPPDAVTVRTSPLPLEDALRALAAAFGSELRRTTATGATSAPAWEIYPIVDG